MEKIGEKKYLNPAWEITVRLNNEEIDTILAIFDEIKFIKKIEVNGGMRGIVEQQFREIKSRS